VLPPDGGGDRGASPHVIPGPGVGEPKDGSFGAAPPPPAGEGFAHGRGQENRISHHHHLQPKKGEARLAATTRRAAFRASPGASHRGRRRRGGALQGVRRGGSRTFTFFTPGLQSQPSQAIPPVPPVPPLPASPPTSPSCLSDSKRVCKYL